jgi:hypothetical protein
MYIKSLAENLVQKALLLFDILSFEVYCRSIANQWYGESELKTKKQDRTIKESELKTNRHNRPIQKSELKTKKQDRTIKESELKSNRHNRPIQKSELKTKKQDRTIKESELKTNRHNRPIQKSELGINRLYRPIQSEDRIGIGRSINRTFRPPLAKWTLLSAEGCHTLPDHSAELFAEDRRALKAVQA